MTISHTHTEALQPTQERRVLFFARKKHRLSKLARQRTVRYGLIFGNVLLVAAIVFFVQRAQNGPSTTALAAGSTSSQAQNDPLDQLSSADIAVNVAEMTDLPETTAVNDRAITADSELAVTPADNTVVAKPQEVATNFASRNDIKTYIAVAGDSVASIATKFNLTTNSVMWSNGLTTNNVNVGMKLVVPPVNGIVYTVKSGDTAASLAQKYQSNEAQITSFNDAEISGLQPGEQIIIPGGQQPASGKALLAGFSSSSAGITTATYGGFGTCRYQGKSYSNYGYDCGFCTWWTAFRRAQAGEPVPSNLGDASSWRPRALSIGMSEGTTPRVGAVMWFTDDHVAYVEDVAADGTVTISEMNHEGWGIENSRTFSAADAATHVYIY